MPQGKSQLKFATSERGCYKGADERKELAIEADLPGKWREGKEGGRREERKEWKGGEGLEEL
jgi:hypothetical protein